MGGALDGAMRRGHVDAVITGGDHWTTWLALCGLAADGERERREVVRRVQDATREDHFAHRLGETADAVRQVAAERVVTEEGAHPILLG